jgi:uncharacterized protein YndB with AHSA1/START domain
MNNQTNKQELTINRLYQAPRDMVWKAWTEPDRIKAWFAPNNFSAPVYQIDLRVGGHYLNCMRSNDGTVEVWGRGNYLEIVPEERLVITDSFADPEGNIVKASYYGMVADYPLESIVTLTFKDEGVQTIFNLTYEDVSTIPAEHLKDLTHGWNECLDKLAEYLAL